LILAAPASAANVNGAKPNVVIILADDLGFGDVSLLNPLARTKTPKIDELGRKSIRFMDAHSGAATCTPSRYALLTGRHYFRSPSSRINAVKLGGVGYLPALIEEGRETIGTMLQKAGYRTACIGKWHLGMDWERKDPSKPVGLLNPGAPSGYTNTDFARGAKNGPNSRGFDRTFIIAASASNPPYGLIEDGRVLDPEMVLIPDLYPARLKSTVVDWDFKYVNEPGDVYWERGVIFKNGEISKSFRIEQGADRILEEAKAFIHRQARENSRQPFLLYFSLTGPHTPWMPVERFRGKSGLGTYGDWVLQMDDAVGQVREALESAGVAENTLVIFSSDNGAHWADDDVLRTAHDANYSRRGQKADIWDGGHHVPFFVSWPARIKREAVYPHPVSLNDVMATLADLTGQKLGPGSAEDSVSFINVIQGDYETPVRDSVLYESSGGLAIVKAGWKFTPVLGSGGFTLPVRIGKAGNGPKGQLYHLVQDPLERTNLFLSEPTKAAELGALLARQVAQGFSAPRLDRGK
jgi:arylsulfatase A